jgi:hypothetical protein
MEVAFPPSECEELISHPGAALQGVAERKPGPKSMLVEVGKVGPQAEANQGMFAQGVLELEVGEDGVFKGVIWF